jgi:hypothetical protein
MAVGGSRLSRFLWIGAVSVVFAFGVGIVLTKSQWGGFGYAAYCGQADPGRRETEHRRHETPQTTICRAGNPALADGKPLADVIPVDLPPDAATPLASAVDGDCELTCNRASGSSPHRERRGSAAVLSGMALMRACRDGEVTVHGRGDGKRCTLDMAVVGEKLDTRILLSNVVVRRLYIERSTLGGITCQRCTLGSPVDGATTDVDHHRPTGFVIRDASIEGSIVLRGGDLPDRLESRWLDPAKYGWDRQDQLVGKDCLAPEPWRALAPVKFPVVFDRAHIAGDLDMRLLELRAPVVIRNSAIDDGFFIDRTVFNERTNFQATRARVIGAVGSRFLHTARFFRLSAERDVDLECAMFEAPVNTFGLSTTGVLNLRRVTFAPQAPGATDVQAPIALDGVHAQLVALDGARAGGAISFGGVSLGALSLVHVCSDSRITFGGVRSSGSSSMPTRSRTIRT